MSENQYYEKIAYTGPMDRSTTIDRIDIMVNAKAIKSKIITNLSEQLFREQLEYLNSLDLSENVIECDLSFLSVLKAVSLALNQNKLSFMHGDFFLNNNAISSCVKLFDVQINIFAKEPSKIEFEKIQNSFRYLLEILMQLTRLEMDMAYEFLKHGILPRFFKFFENENLLKLLFERHISFFTRAVKTFLHLCKRLSKWKLFKIPFDNYLNDENIPFDLLIKTRDYIEKLYEQSDSSDPMHLEFFQPLFRNFLRCLGYINEAFKPQTQLLSIKHYELIAKSSFATRYFDKIRKDFIDVCNLKYYEFYNELDKIELEKVNNFNIYNNRPVMNSNFYFVESLNMLKELFTTPQLIIIAYTTHQYFFKSIIYYGVDIEKLLGLQILTKFCLVEEVRKHVFNDVNFSGFVEDMHDNISKNKGTFADNLKERLNNCIFNFLQFEKA